MLKLKDIFKLNLNTGGGNKLFARIMNKYNVPKKEYEKVKEEMNSFSGGGDSDSAEYYRISSNISDMEMIIKNALVAVKLTENGKTAICGYYDAYSVNTLFFNYKIIPINPIFTLVLREEFKGNTFKELTIEFLLKSEDSEGNFPSVEEANTIFNSCFSPITKEEFYDLNNI